MKRSFLLISLAFGLFMSIFALTACSSDDDDSSSNPLVGTWKHEDGKFWTIFIFRSDFTYTLKDSEEREDHNAVYSIDGNTIYFYLNGDRYDTSESNIDIATFNVKGNTLTLIDQSDNIGEVTVYTRQ